MAEQNLGRVFGWKGWTPLYAEVRDGLGDDYRMVWKLVDFVDGEGPKPTLHLNEYLTETGGFTPNIALGANSRGQKGQTGDKGATGATGVTATTVENNRLLGNTAGVTGSPHAIDAVGFTLKNGKLINGHGNESTTNANRNIISNPLGGLYLSNVATTGALFIKLPNFFASSAGFDIKGSVSMLQDTGLIGNFLFHITASNYSSSRGMSATIIGANAVKHTVRWYADVDAFYVYIGELTTVWPVYTTFSLFSVTSTFLNNQIESVISGWSTGIEQVAFKGTQSKIQLEPRPQFNPNQILGDYQQGSESDTRLTNAMSLNTAFQNLQGQLTYQRDSIEVKSLRSTFANGCIIRTSINFATVSFEIGINIYGDSRSVDDGRIIINGALTATPDFSNVRAITTGFTPLISLIRESNGLLSIWFSIPVTASRSVSAYAYLYTDTNAKNLVTGIGNVVKPVDLTLEATTTPSRTLSNNGLATNLILGNGAYKPITDFFTKNSVTNVAASKTLALTDQNSTQDVTATATITVPTNATQAFSVGEQISGIVRAGVTLTIAPVGGVTILNKGSLIINGYSTFTLEKIGGNVWALTVI